MTPHDRGPAASSILFLASEIPHPPRSGGTIKSAALLAHLERRHAVRVVCFARHPLTDEQRRWCAEQGQVDVVLLNRRRTPANLVRSYIARTPLSIERNRSRDMATLVSERLRTDPPDVVFVDGWLMAQYVPSSFRGLKILHQHNAEHLLWERQANLERNRARRALIHAEFRRVRRYEAALLSRFDAVFAVSKADRRALENITSEPVSVALLPNVADSRLLTAPALSPNSSSTLLFLGTLSWEPNAVGLESFLRAVFPEVRRRQPEARFVIAGRGASPRLARLIAGTEGAELAEHADDPESLYRSARVFVDASRGGSGTRVKILNAMARGLPVVATADAASGLDAVPEEHLLVANRPGSMAEAIGRLLTDRTLWMSLSRNARRLVRHRYVPGSAFRALDDVLAASNGSEGGRRRPGSGPPLRERAPRKDQRGRQGPR
jgi:glycosyltransferase involved in cell wall biosynthesis